MKFAISLSLAAMLCVSSFCQAPSKSTKAALAALAREQKTRDLVKAQLDKHPKDNPTRKRFVTVNDKFAYDTMTCDGLTPHEKYSGALKIYRQTLKVDPKDPEANKWVNMIVSIYKSMHRPVPQ